MEITSTLNASDAKTHPNTLKNLVRSSPQAAGLSGGRGGSRLKRHAAKYDANRSALRGVRTPALSLLNNLPLHSFKGICVFYCSRSFLCRLFTSPTLVVSVAPTVLQPQNHATKIANNSDFKLVKSCQTKVGKAREAAFCCDFINLRSP